MRHNNASTDCFFTRSLMDVFVIALAAPETFKTPAARKAFPRANPFAIQEVRVDINKRGNDGWDNPPMMAA